MIAIQCFIGDSPKNLQRNLNSGEIIWPKNKTVNNELTKILDKMVRLESTNRYSNPQEVLKALELLQKKTGKGGFFNRLKPMYWYIFLLVIALIVVVIFLR